MSSRHVMKLGSCQKMSKCAWLFVGLLAHNENRRIWQGSRTCCLNHERKEEKSQVCEKSLK